MMRLCSQLQDLATLAAGVQRALSGFGKTGVKQLTFAQLRIKSVQLAPTFANVSISQNQKVFQMAKVCTPNEPYSLCV